MTRFVIVALVALSVSARAQDTGGFVVTLGNDTLSAESYTRTGNRIEGIIARRVPRAVVVRYTLDLAPDGTARRLEYNTRLPDGSVVPNGSRSVAVTFTRDSAFTEIQRDSVLTRRVAVTNGFPEIDGSVALYATAVALLRAGGGDSALVMTYPAGVPAGDTTAVLRRAARVFDLYSFGSPIRLGFDADGRLQTVDASRTTFRIMAAHQPVVDVMTMARAFADRERAFGAMLISPRDSTIVTVAGARVHVDYGSPAARGRNIWGPRGVLGDTLWRTGANASTKFNTDAALSFGGRMLPAGNYVLTTLAVPGRYQLIFSRENVEVLRVPLQPKELSPKQERFKVAVEPSGAGGTLRLRWDAMELSAPFTVQR